MDHLANDAVSRSDPARLHGSSSPTGDGRAVGDALPTDRGPRGRPPTCRARKCSASRTSARDGRSGGAGSRRSRPELPRNKSSSPPRHEGPAARRHRCVPAQRRQPHARPGRRSGHLRGVPVDAAGPKGRRKLLTGGRSGSPVLRTYDDGLAVTPSRTVDRRPSAGALSPRDQRRQRSSRCRGA